MLVRNGMTTTAFRLLFVFAAIFAVGAIGFSLPKLGGNLTLSYLPSGIALAATYQGLSQPPL